jgi:hypothetical protein
LPFWRPRGGRPTTQRREKEFGSHTLFARLILNRGCPGRNPNTNTRRQENAPPKGSHLCQLVVRILKKLSRAFSVERRVCSYAKSIFSGLPFPSIFQYVGKTSLMLLLTILKIKFVQSMSDESPHIGSPPPFTRHKYYIKIKLFCVKSYILTRPSVLHIFIRRFSITSPIRIWDSLTFSNINPLLNSLKIYKPKIYFSPINKGRNELFALKPSRRKHGFRGYIWRG